MSDAAITMRELRLLRHMLGSSHEWHVAQSTGEDDGCCNAIGWRNYAAVRQGDPEMASLAERGIVERGRCDGAYDYYHVTKEWAEALGAVLR